MATDALKLITLRRSRPSSRLVLAFARRAGGRVRHRGQLAVDSTGGGGIEVVVVDLDEGLRAGLLAAQVRQEMVNRPETSE